MPPRCRFCGGWRRPHHRRCGPCRAGAGISACGAASATRDPLLANHRWIPAGEITLMEFTARRPFHPERSYAASTCSPRRRGQDPGRAFVANRLDDVMWIESAGGGVLIENAGKWLAAMASNERALQPTRATHWRRRVGRRSATGTYPWRCWSAVDSQPRSAAPYGARFSPMRNWPGRVNGRSTPTRSGDYTPILRGLADVRDELTARPNHHQDEER